MPEDDPQEAAQLRTTATELAATEARLKLDRGVDYQQMRGMIESSLFGEPAAPLLIGRFAVLDRIGAGGMGTVYAAYDDTLDRKVAVKVLHGTASEEARERMLREARAMARLSHPNIVTVHEVGEHEGRVFLAMEFVRGRSLDQWIHEQDEPRPWRETLEVFARAGEGLVAAHEAGLVHRDFKPHNVVQGDDGMVKVLDFGVAFPTAPAGPSTPREGLPETSSVNEEQSLTRTGAIVGTPAYMAPEQLMAKPATAASDQFAFCVSLYEALHGERPFAGKRLEALIDAVCEGRLREPPPGSTVPAWVRAIVRRGLSTDPADRFESMRALLEALGRDPALARRRWLGGLAVAGLAVVGSFGLAALQKQPPAEPCQGLESALDDVWGPNRVTQVRQGFLASEVPYADETWARIEPRLDAYAQEWIDGSTNACLAHEAGRQSPKIFDLRTVCLESRRASLRAVVERLEHADGGVVGKVMEIMGGLPPLARCDDLEALTATVPPPDDPEQAEAIREARQQLATARVQEDAGHVAEAIALATEARTTADALEYAPLQAEAALRLGSATAEGGASTRDFERSDEVLSEAMHTAIGAGHVIVAIEALARRVYVRAELLNLNRERIQEDEPLVRALLKQDPADAHVRWLVANNLGIMHERGGDWAAATKLYDEALEHARSRGEGGLQNVAVVLTNRALTAMDQDELVAAETDGRAALEIAERMLGPRHPRIPLHLYPVAHSLMARGRHEEARTLFERAMTIRESSGLPLPPDAAQDLHMLSVLATTRREHARARELSDRGLELLDADHPFTIRLLHGRADAKIGEGDIEGGLADHRRALAVVTKLNEPDALPIAESHEALGEALTRTGDREAAVAELDRAVTLVPAKLIEEWVWLASGRRRRAALHVAEGEPEPALALIEPTLETLRRRAAPGHPELAKLWRLRGDALAQQGAIQEALEAYEAALAEYQREHDEDHPELAACRFALAQTLARCVDEAGCTPDGATTRDRASSLADTATRAYRKLGPAFAPEAEAIAKWRESQYQTSTTKRR
ncbi:MAG: protein kinase [Myxococcota bacterium]